MVGRSLFGNIYAGKTVLVTGDTGFKGSWLCLWLNNLGANVIGFSDAVNTNPSHYSILNPSYQSYRGDIENGTLLTEIMNSHKVEVVFHLAAQSLVRASYTDPHETYRVNVMGSLSLMRAIQQSSSVNCLINITTDKVYENEEIEKAYAEEDRLGGYDMYSSSKACVEILTESFVRSFFSDRKIAVSTVRAGNVIGGGDWAKDRLLPDLMSSAGANTSALIRNPFSIRPWQHVLEPLSGYLILGQRMMEQPDESCGAWNFGPEKSQCVSVGNVVEILKSVWPEIKVETLGSDHKQPHEAKILMLSFEKARVKLGWSPIWNLSETIQYTAQWYKEFFHSGNSIAPQQIERYIEDASAKNSAWTR
jgi:CDP-glucose 4,6-dehydratase